MQNNTLEQRLHWVQTNDNFFYNTQYWYTIYKGINSTLFCYTEPCCGWFVEPSRQINDKLHFSAQGELKLVTLCLHSASCLCWLGGGTFFEFKGETQIVEICTLKHCEWTKCTVNQNVKITLYKAAFGKLNNTLCVKLHIVSKRAVPSSIKYSKNTSNALDNLNSLLKSLIN